MRALGMAAAGAVAGWFGGLLVIVAVRVVTDTLLPTPVTLKGLEIVLAVAGLLGGAVWGASEDRKAAALQRRLREQHAAYVEHQRRHGGDTP